jgi:hypothetical protein
MVCDSRRQLRIAIEFLEDLDGQLVFMASSYENEKTTAIRKLRWTLQSSFKDHDQHLVTLDEYINAECPPLDVCRELVIEERLRGEIDRLFGLILRGCDETYHWFFRLGECIDEGIRPQSVYRRMFDFAKWSADLHAASKLDCQELDDWAESIAPEQPDDDELPTGNALANCVRQPGALPPDRDWQTRLRSYLERLGLLLDFTGFERTDSIIDFADQVVRLADQPRRLIVLFNPLMAILDGIPYALRNLDSACFLDTLIHANGLIVGPASVGILLRLVARRQPLALASDLDQLRVVAHTATIASHV